MEWTAWDQSKNILGRIGKQEEWKFEFVHWAGEEGGPRECRVVRFSVDPTGHVRLAQDTTEYPHGLDTEGISATHSTSIELPGWED